MKFTYFPSKYIYIYITVQVLLAESAPIFETKSVPNWTHFLVGQYIGYKVSDIPGGPSLPFPLMLTWMVLLEFVSNHKINK